FGQNVERRAGEVVPLEGVADRIDVDDGSARGIDQQRASLHRRERRRVDHPARLRGQAAMQRDDVGLLEKRGERGALGTCEREASVVDVRVGGDHADTPRFQQLGDTKADAPEPDDAYREARVTVGSPPDVNALETLVAPTARLDVPVARADALQE